MEGLKVGLYFTLIDWHHPDYPKYNDMHHPMRGNEAYKDENINLTVSGIYAWPGGRTGDQCRKLDILWLISLMTTCVKIAGSRRIDPYGQKHQRMLCDNRLEGSGRKGRVS